MQTGDKVTHNGEPGTIQGLSTSGAGKTTVTIETDVGDIIQVNAADVTVTSERTDMVLYMERLRAQRDALLDDLDWRIVRYLSQKAGGIDATDSAGRVIDFHALRHTFISSLVAGGVHPKTAQGLSARGRSLFFDAEIRRRGRSSDECSDTDLGVPGASKAA